MHDTLDVSGLTLQIIYSFLSYKLCGTVHERLLDFSNPEVLTEHYHKTSPIFSSSLATKDFFLKPPHDYLF